MNNEINIDQKEAEIIAAIVEKFSPGERVKTVRSIFKTRCNSSHFLYLGVLLEREKERNSLRQIQNVVDRMQVLSFVK